MLIIFSLDYSLLDDENTEILKVSVTSKFIVWQRKQANILLECSKICTLKLNIEYPGLCRMCKEYRLEMSVK